MYKGDIERAMEYLENLNSAVEVKLIDNEGEILKSGTAAEMIEFLKEDETDTPFLCCLNRDEEVNRLKYLVRNYESDVLFRALFSKGSEIKSAEEWAEFDSFNDTDDDFICGGLCEGYRGFIEDNYTKKEALDALDDVVRDMDYAYQYGALTEDEQDENKDLVYNLKTVVGLAKKAGVEIKVNDERFTDDSMYFYDFPEAIEDKELREKVQCGEIELDDFSDEFYQAREEVRAEIEHIKAQIEAYRKG